METIDLILNEENELIFDIELEGNITSNPEVRLVCEDDNDVSFSFKGRESASGVSFIIPKMENRIQPGEYDTTLEILVDNQCIKPMKLITNFKKGNNLSIKKANIKSIKENKKAKATASIRKKPTNNPQKEKQVKKISQKDLRRLLSK